MRYLVIGGITGTDPTPKDEEERLKNECIEGRILDLLEREVVGKNNNINTRY